MRAFLLFIVAGGFGGLAGSVAGSFFHMPLAGGLTSGLIASPFAPFLPEDAPGSEGGTRRRDSASLRGLRTAVTRRAAYSNSKLADP